MSESPVFNRKITRHMKKQKTMVHSQEEKEIDRNHPWGRLDSVLQDKYPKSIFSSKLQELKETREQCLKKHRMSIKRQTIIEITKKFRNWKQSNWNEKVSWGRRTTADLSRQKEGPENLKTGESKLSSLRSRRKDSKEKWTVSVRPITSGAYSRTRPLSPAWSLPGRRQHSSTTHWPRKRSAERLNSCGGHHRQEAASHSSEDHGPTHICDISGFWPQLDTFHLQQQQPYTLILAACGRWTLLTSWDTTDTHMPVGLRHKKQRERFGLLQVKLELAPHRWRLPTPSHIYFHK